MLYHKSNRIQLGAALLLCSLALLLCLSLFIVAHAHHACFDVHCPICLQISHVTALLRSFSSVGIFILSSVLFGYMPTAFVLSGETVTWLIGRSLVALRTRMDD